MKVVILCGGQGTRLREVTEIRPKPMVEIGVRPILWHIMKGYSHHGFDDFILCLGYKGDTIKRYFYDYEWLTRDCTIELGSRKIEFHGDHHPESQWRVTLVDTGLTAGTGARVKRIEPFVDSDTFMLTYGDGVTDLDVRALLHFHRSHGKIGTVTAVCPPSRYGELFIQGNRVVSFTEKPQATEGFISGGYFVFRRDFFRYLSTEDGCVLEREPLERLAGEGQLMVYNHPGFWQCMDTPRDYDYLCGLWNRGEGQWKTWE